MTAKTFKKDVEKTNRGIADKHKASQIISESIGLEDYKKAKSIFIYINTDEVSTDKIIETLYRASVCARYKRLWACGDISEHALQTGKV